jgi:hypothetical protein
MPIISITYLPESSISGIIFRPTIPIWMSKNNKYSYMFQAMVDSGSDKNLFPAHLGEIIGINIPSGTKSNVYGIGNYELIVYKHKIKLHLAKYTFETTIDFSYEQTVPLLGRKENKKVLDLEI